MLPGDLVSLYSGVTGGKSAEDQHKSGGDDDDMESTFSVRELPADVLLLRGTAVVDEASLTGESVPQIKTSLTSELIDLEDDLDMTGVSLHLSQQLCVCWIDRVRVFAWTLFSCLGLVCLPLMIPIDIGQRGHERPAHAESSPKVSLFRTGASVVVNMEFSRPVRAFLGDADQTLYAIG